MKRLIRLSMAASALIVILLLVSSMQSQSLKASSNENIKIEKSMRQERKKASDDANMQKSDKDLATRVRNRHPCHDREYECSKSIVKQITSARECKPI